MPITSPHNEALKEIRKLAGRRWRDKLGEFVAEGEDLLAAADAAGWEPLARYVRIAITLEAGAVALDFSAVLAVTYLVPDAVERAADARREHVGLPIDEFSGVDDAFAVARARLDEDALAQSYDFVIRRERPGQPVDRRQVLRHRSPQRGGECGFVRIENAPLNLQRFAIAIARR